MSGLVVGNYRIEQRLGAGTFATVWLAWDPGLERHVAIKVLADNWSTNEDVRRRFLDEAKILWRLEHPRIVRVFLTGTLDDGRPYFVMEYADAGSLLDRTEDHKAQGQPFSIAEAVTLSCDIADGLIVAHARGIIHRDLKPSNVMFTKTRGIGDTSSGEQERLMLADFGIARQLERATHMTIAAGTPNYMAPEQYNPQPGASPNQQSDVYSAATVLYELLAGVVPYPYSSVSQIMRAQEQNDRKPIRELRAEVPDALAAAVDKGLASSLAERFRSAEEWRAAIAPFAIEEVVAVPSADGNGSVRAPEPLISDSRQQIHEAGSDDSTIAMETPLVANAVEPARLPPRQFADPASTGRRPWNRTPILGLAIGSVIVLLVAIGLFHNNLPFNNSSIGRSENGGIVQTPTPSSAQASTTTNQGLVPASTDKGSSSDAVTSTDSGVVRLRETFSFISAGHNCVVGTPQADIDAAVRCNDESVVVLYVEYTSAEAMTSFINEQIATNNPTVLTWAYNSDSTATVQGTELLLTGSTSNSPEIIWTVDANNMAGDALAISDGFDITQLHDWWSSAGSRRPGS